MNPERAQEGAIAIEIYRCQPQQAVLETFTQEDCATTIARRNQLCDALGLSAQARRECVLDPGLFYHELPAHEQRVWHAFLPKTYCSDKSSRTLSWGNYQYDCIPMTVLEELDFAQKTGLFMSLQIWTPEDAQYDPIAVGVTVDQRLFLLARWGESLLPFAEVERRTWWSIHALRFFRFALLGILVTSIVVPLVMTVIK